MKIQHTFTYTKNKQLEKELRMINIDLDEELLHSKIAPLINFQIYESDEKWPEACKLIIKYNLKSICHTTFHKKEIAQSMLMAMLSNHPKGYPMPDMDFGYREKSFNLNDYCETCGIGMKQNNPICMRSEPKWGTSGILQLNWVMDEFFVKPEIWEKVFKPFGIKTKPVMHHRKKIELETVLQLDIDDSKTYSLDLKDCEYEKCVRCNRKKHTWISRGKFPKLLEKPKQPIVKSTEYFGSGAEAFQAVVINHELWTAIEKANLKGARFIPLEQ